MDNPIWNLIAKAASLLACFLLCLATALIFSAHIGLTQNSTPGLITLVFAVAIALFAIGATSFLNSSAKRELRAASAIAHQLSQGEIYDEEADTELLESLKNISVYLSERSIFADRIAAGDMTENLTVRSDGDVLGNSFQRMIENLRTHVQTKETRDRLQNSIIKLLDEVSEVAAGDLTVQAEISTEITGEIAGAFNSMTRNLRSLIKQVKDVTVQVGASANAINDTTEQLARGSVIQASQISRTTTAISTMATQIQEVSENAELSAKVASDSLSNARFGTRAAKDNINAMNSVRKQVQEIAKRIKRLGERSQEIGQIVGLIDDLSDRTSLLALNASLKSSAVGETVSGFGVVAEEVERLSERSNRLTQQISALTHTINVETKEVVAATEETIREVIVSSTLADKAGQSLVEIEQISTKLADLLKSISESTKFQAKSSEDISIAMAGISEVTELVETGSKRAAESVRMLVELSDELRTAVSPFKLPAEMRSPKPPPGDVNLFVN